MSAEFDSYLIAELCCISGVVLCGLVCGQIIQRHRHHPVLKYRTFPLYLTALFSGCAVEIIQVVEQLPNAYIFISYTAMEISKNIFIALINSAISTVGIRYWALVATRYMQGKLMDARTCSDPKVYKSVKLQVSICKALTYQRNAIRLFYCILFLYGLLYFYPYFSSANIKISANTAAADFACSVMYCGKKNNLLFLYNKQLT